MELPQDLLERPVEEAARLIALSLLNEARAARARLDQPGDIEALHDFRVALRRLRSILRAYRRYLKDSLSTPMRRRLRALATATGGSRDAEVRIAWLQAQKAKFSARQHVGLTWLITSLTEHKQRADTALQKQARQGFCTHGAPARQAPRYL